MDITDISDISNDDGFLEISDFIYTKRKALDKDLCEEIIDKYEDDDRKTPCVIGKYSTVDKLVHDAMNLHISTHSGWKETDAIISKILGENIREYQKYLASHCKGLGLNPLDTYQDDGYLIKSYTPGGFYNWHNDYYVDYKLGPRVLTYIFYLNDVKNGGETQFIDGTSIRPQTGKLILFPAAWPFSHRARKVKNRNKYILTGWLYGRNTLDEEKRWIEDNPKSGIKEVE